jgi:Mg2+/Co2+ transporter CorB
LIFAIVAILILIQAFFAGAEIALLSADRISLQSKAKAGSKIASRALQLIKEPERIFSTTLLITSLCIVTSSVLIALWVIENFGSSSDLLAILITSPAIVLFGEVLPKTLFQLHSGSIAPWVAPVIHATFYVFYPVTSILGRYTSRLSRAIDPLEELIVGKKRSTRDELRALVGHRGSACLDPPSKSGCHRARIIRF